LERGDDQMLKYAKIIEECNPSQTHSEMNELLIQLEKISIKNILEIGVHRGGSTRVWQKVFNPEILIGIDWSIEPNAIMPGLELIEGNSHDQLTFQKVQKILKDQPLDFLFIDGGHLYDEVKKDFELYSPLVRNGGAIGFHDVILTGNDTCEVYRYWNDIKDKCNSITISHKDQWGAIATGTGLVWK
jgi:predicted O-methyltransferase YrrM